MAWKFNPNYNSLPEQVAKNKEDIEKLKNIPDKVGTKVLKNAPGNPAYETLKLVGSDFINVDEDEFDPNQLDFRLDQLILDLINEKVKSVKESEKVYATDNLGNPTTLQYNVNPYGDGLVKRSNDGRVKGKDGVEPDDLVNKKQLDSKPNFSDIPNVKGFIKNEPNAFDYNNLANKPNIPEGVKLYNDLGQNEDGAINQKAATNNFATKLELGLKQNVLSEQQILNINNVPNKADKSEIPSTEGFIKNVPNAYDYDNLKDKPTIPSTEGFIKNVPNAYDYDNLKDKPIIPSTAGFIKNEPNAFSYNNLSDKPTIPVINKPVTIWQNGNPNVDYGQNKVTLSQTMTSFDYLILGIKNNRDTNNAPEIMLFKPQLNAAISYVSCDGKAKAIKKRGFWMHGDNISITIDPCYNNGSVLNSQLIPVFIKGGKL